jgi:hypothetical protein
MAAANFWFCTMISSSALRGGIQVQRADRDVGAVGDLLRCDPADAVFCEEFARARPDAFALVLLRPLPAADRHPSVDLLDIVTELTHN